MIHFERLLSELDRLTRPAPSLVDCGLEHQLGHLVLLDLGELGQTQIGLIEHELVGTDFLISLEAEAAADTDLFVSEVLREPDLGPR